MATAIHGSIAAGRVFTPITSSSFPPDTVPTKKDGNWVRIRQTISSGQPSGFLRITQAPAGQLMFLPLPLHGHEYPVRQRRSTAQELRGLCETVWSLCSLEPQCVHLGHEHSGSLLACLTGASEMHDGERGLRELKTSLPSISPKLSIPAPQPLSAMKIK